MTSGAKKRSGDWKQRPRRVLVHAGLYVGVVILAVVGLAFVVTGVLVNGYGKVRAEQLVAKAYPGFVIRIAELHYSVGANRLVARSVRLRGAGTIVKADRVALTGVRWAPLFWGTAALKDVCARASVEAANIDVEFPSAHYGLRCERLRASVPDSKLLAEDSELRALVSDADFFATHAFRTTRFHVVVPECRASGLAYRELLQGKSYRATSITFVRPSFDALVNRDRPVEPSPETPLMVNEALAAIRVPVQVDSLSITNGRLIYGERTAVGTAPGVLTFAAVNISAEGIANSGGTSAAIRVQARGDLMGAGAMSLLMSIPITPRDFSLHYSGSLGAMDLTRLDAFLENAEHTRIASGRAQQAAFEVNVTAGHAHGRVRAIYDNLEIAVLDKRTGDETGLANRAASFLENAFRIRKSNAPDESGAIREGEVNYTRRPEDEFLQFLWFALRTGILDLIARRPISG